MGVTDGHIRTLLRDCSLEGVIFVSRIVSGRQAKPTSLVRIISSSHQEVQSLLDSLLKEGLYDPVARRRYRVVSQKVSNFCP